MIDASELSSRERLALSVDTGHKKEAISQVKLAKRKGGKFIKFGSVFVMAAGPDYCSRLAESNGLLWICDLKFYDNTDTVRKTIEVLKNKPQPPIGITLHAKAREETLRIAQATAGEIIIFGVTELSGDTDQYLRRHRHMTRLNSVMELGRKAARTGLKGIVASPLEIESLKSNGLTAHLLSLIPGSRSEGVPANDQVNTDTPKNSIVHGADILVLGREVTEAANRSSAYDFIIDQVDEGLVERKLQYS